MNLFGNSKATVPAPQNTNAGLPYGDYGIIPGVAQTAQNAIYAPALFTQPVFSAEQLAHANWFTTRVHLAPLGKA